MSLDSGTKLGPYEILAPVGAGGMGEVYLAEDTRLHRKVAVKLLPDRLASDHRRMQRFKQEAMAAASLNHPHIAHIYEIGQAADVQFIAMEYVDGETLRERIRNGPMRLADVVDVSEQMAGALSAAHAAGIIHRDIKPENVIVRRDGLVKVLDFGLAKLAQRHPESTDSNAPTRVLVNTAPGVVMGTAIYMSPEQARGLEVDERTDIFSLGIVLYEMIAGCLPFTGSTANDVVASLLSDNEPPPLARYSREVPGELERITSKALRKNKDERYQTIKDLHLDLQTLKQELEFQRKLQRSISSTASSGGPTPTRTETASRPSISESRPFNAISLSKKTVGL